MESKKINWHQLERGVPITNDSFFVRLEDETGFIYDDRGGYMHHKFCDIDTRREITWLEHDKSDCMPVDLDDAVIIETIDNKLLLRRARYINWTTVACYRVVKQGGF
jgi:hypothetical protein